MNSIMSHDQQAKILAWIDRIQSLRLELETLYQEFDAVAAKRLELKHSIESKEARIAKLEKRGALSNEVDEDEEDADQPSLFDAPVPEDSIADLDLPKRIRQKLEKCQVETVTRLRNVMDGLDREFANLESIFGSDHDAIKRIQSTLRDEDADDEESVSVPYAAPTPTEVVKAEIPSSDKSSIRLKIAIDEMEIGSVCEATLTGNGQAVLEDGTMLESGEFELTEVAEAV